MGWPNARTDFNWKSEYLSVLCTLMSFIPIAKIVWVKWCAFAGVCLILLYPFLWNCITVSLLFFPGCAIWETCIKQRLFVTRRCNFCPSLTTGAFTVPLNHHVWIFPNIRNTDWDKSMKVNGWTCELWKVSDNECKLLIHLVLLL